MVLLRLHACSIFWNWNGLKKNMAYRCTVSDFIPTECYIKKILHLYLEFLTVYIIVLTKLIVLVIKTYKMSH